MQTNEVVAVEDPNAATDNEKKLKRVETAIRRRVRADLLMKLDGVALIGDKAKQMRELLALKHELEH
ncbi:hypothetical protein [Ralstonia sp. ASV6]|uniref:hypothetical protein n=1 Tax=Ralstonia sp. ASV6 TaxID=2795124 RepID=UPI0018EB39AE|nr:hypothetical protein [Ralstonia sp. ASV6]